MATKPKFRYSLKDETDKQWYYVQNGIVRLSNTPKYLEGDAQTTAPKEWKETVLELSRNEELHGVFTNFSVPLSFTLDAHKILKQIFGGDGYEGTAVFVIESRNNQQGYDDFYSANINMLDVQGAFTNDEIHFQVTTTETGLIETVQNEKDKTVEIPFDNDALTVYNDGIKLQEQMKWVGSSNGLLGSQPFIDYPIIVKERLFPTMSYVGRDTSAYLANHIFPRTQDLHQTITDASKFLVSVLIPAQFELNLDYDIEVFTNNFMQATGQLNIDMMIIPNPVNTATVATRQPVARRVTVPINSSVRFSGLRNFNFSVPANHTLKFELSVTNGIADPSQNIVIRVHKLDLSLKMTARLPATEYPAFRYKTFLEKFFRKLSNDSSVSVLSDFFDNGLEFDDGYDSNPAWVTVTSGEGIRRVAGGKIKVSLQKIIKDLQRWQLGIGVEGNNIRVERLPYFYQKDEVITRLSNVSDVKYQVAKDRLFNLMKFGYPNKEYDELNGREDFFVTNEYSFPSKRVSKTLDLTSAFYASCWAIEYARAMYLAGKDTTDSRYDEDIYLTEVDLLHVNGKFPVKRHTAGTVFGLTYPDTIYNTGLTPATTAYYNAERILAAGWGKPINEGTDMGFNTNEKDSNFSRLQNSKYIAEKAPLKFSQLRAQPNHKADNTNVTPYCIPVIIEVEATISEADMALMRVNNDTRYGVVEFVHPQNGEIFSMFVLDIGLYPATHDKYLVRGLSSPDNNIINL